MTVVWIAKNPQTARPCIVGWYQDATIYHEQERFRFTRAPGFDVAYQVSAPVSDATLLSPDARVFEVPTGKGGIGQSPIWYGSDDEFREQVRAYIAKEGIRSKAKRARKPGRQLDPEKRRKIENAAVQHAITYFESDEGGRRSVRTVEKEGVGWDLEATSFAGDVLKVEVKGTAYSDISVELRPLPKITLSQRSFCDLMAG